ncbi:MAG: hypothetical protein ACI9EF_001699 [Pseudohongiellaceae bacterium]|jgi:hypothetical protein
MARRQILPAVPHKKDSSHRGRPAAWADSGGASPIRRRTPAAGAQPSKRLPATRTQSSKGGIARTIRSGLPGQPYRDVRGSSPQPTMAADCEELPAKSLSLGGVVDLGSHCRRHIWCDFRNLFSSHFRCDFRCYLSSDFRCYFSSDFRCYFSSDF